MFEISRYINLSNVDNTFFAQNNHHDFKSTVDLDFLSLEEELKCEIALTYFEVVPILPSRIKKWSKIYSHYLKIANLDLIRVCLIDSGLTTDLSDNCIAELRPVFDVGTHIKFPTYFPIVLKKHNIFQVKLLTAQNNNLKLPVRFRGNINYVISCSFHIRTMSFSDTKFLRLISDDKEDKKNYPNNKPLSFTSTIYPSFHQRDDFTSWQVALDSLYVSRALMTYFKNASFIQVCGGEQPFFDPMCSYETAPSLREFSCDVKLKRDNKSMFVFRCHQPIYFNVQKRYLDEITLNVVFKSGPFDMELKEEDITDQMFVRINLLFRRKIQDF